MNFFEAPHSQVHFSGRPVVLFIDEFDLLFEAPPAVIDSLLNVLRAAKQQPADTCLHVCPPPHPPRAVPHFLCLTRAHPCLQSVVAIGTFSILELTGRSASPFNVRDALVAPNLSESQVRSLFEQYREASGVSVDERIPTHVHSLTGGHA
jgi:hypothetical protein